MANLRCQALHWGSVFSLSNLTFRTTLRGDARMTPISQTEGQSLTEVKFLAVESGPQGGPECRGGRVPRVPLLRAEVMVFVLLWPPPSLLTLWPFLLCICTLRSNHSGLF